jgi:hypothetical protein
MSWWRRSFLSLAIAMPLVALLAACDEGPAENAGEAVDEAAEDAGEAAEEAGDEAEDAAD